MYNPWFVQYNRKTFRYKKTANGKIITIHDCQRPGLFSTRQSPELKPNRTRKGILVGGPGGDYAILFVFALTLLDTE